MIIYLPDKWHWTEISMNLKVGFRVSPTWFCSIWPCHWPAWSCQFPAAEHVTGTTEQRELWDTNGCLHASSKTWHRSWETSEKHIAMMSRIKPLTAVYSILFTGSMIHVLLRPLLKWIPLSLKTLDKITNVLPWAFKTQFSARIFFIYNKYKTPLPFSFSFHHFPLLES